MSIPFIPLDHIVNTFDEVSDGVEESVLDLSLYIERTFVRGIPARGRRREVPPRFPPHVWNVYNLVLNGTQRTINTIEGWHSKFKKCIVTHHANIWKFIENLQKDQNDNQLLINQLMAGHMAIRHPIKKSYVLNSRHIEEMVRNYHVYRENGDVDRYLRGISYRLKLYAEELPYDENDNEEN